MNGRHGRILRIRPGPMANFSSDGSYLLFLVIAGGTVGFIFGLLVTMISNLTVFFVARAMVKGQKQNTGPINSPDVWRFAAYARTHLTVLAVILVTGASAFVYWLLDGASHDASDLGFALLLVGPFAAVFLSTWSLVSAIRRGSMQRVGWLFASILVYCGLTLLVVLIGSFLLIVFGSAEF